LAIAALVVWTLTAGAGVALLARVGGQSSAEGHPLLEFAHPALGVIGLGSWFMFVATRYRTFEWISVGVLAVTIGAGLTWLAISTRAARRGDRPAGSAPARVIVAHGLAAATATILVLLSIR
jgi:hypothetical protein